MFSKNFLLTRLMQAVVEGTEGGTATETQAEADRKRAPASNFLPIVRGRLPLLFVHAIRFDATLNSMSNKDLAAKFATSVGKVFDIKKGRNFAYVDANFKPSGDDVSAADDWVKQIGAENAKGIGAQGDKDLLGKVVQSYKDKGLATAEESAAFSATRTATRTPVQRKDSSAAPADGQSEGVQITTTANTADDLLS